MEELPKWSVATVNRKGSCSIELIKGLKKIAQKDNMYCNTHNGGADLLYSDLD